MRFLRRPLDTWDNPGLMLSDDRRAEMQAKHLWAAKLIDWPELRTLFRTHDNAANRLRWLVRWQGRIAIIFSVIGLVLTASLPISSNLMPEKVRIVGVLASALILTGGILGLEHLLKGTLKSRWLVERFWTERLRQIYFQVILVSLKDLATSDPTVISDWQRSRNLILERFCKETMSQPAAAVREVEADVLDKKAWFVDHGQPQVERAYLNSEKISELIAFLQIQRLEDQYNYIKDKIEPGLFSPRSSANFVDRVTTLFAILTISTAACIAFLNMWYEQINTTALTYGLAIQASVSACFAGAKVFDEGLGFSKERELYTWYESSVAKLRNDFERSNINGKIEILFKLVF